MAQIIIIAFRFYKTNISDIACNFQDEMPEYLPNPDGRDELFGYINSRNGLTKRERFAVGALVELLRNSIPATVGELVEAVKATPAMERAGFWRQTDIVSIQYTSTQ